MTKGQTEAATDDERSVYNLAYVLALRARDLAALLDIASDAGDGLISEQLAGVARIAFDASEGADDLLESIRTHDVAANPPMQMEVNHE